MSLKNTFIQNIYNEYQRGYLPDQPEYVGWTTEEAQRSRWIQLLTHVNHGDKLLDFGCGVGGLYAYVIEHGLSVDYYGVDINWGYISNAVRFHKHMTNKFRLIVNHKSITDNYDWTVCSGVFTTMFGIDEVMNVLEHLISISSKGVSFNMLKFVEKFVGSDLVVWDEHMVLNELKTKYPYYTIEYSTDYTEDNDDFTIHIIK